MLELRGTCSFIVTTMLVLVLVVRLSMNSYHVRGFGVHAATPTMLPLEVHFIRNLPNQVQVT